MQALGRGKVIYADAANGTALRTGRYPDQAVASVKTAYAKLSANKQDTVALLPSTASDNWASGLDWALNLSNLRGEGLFGRMNHRARIGHSANFATLLTVSGYGNYFENFYIAHGRGNAGNLCALNVTGARNTFENVHIGGPFHATEANTAGYRLVKLASSETTFRNCFFGADTIPLTAGISFLEFVNTADPTRCIFENCIFMCAINAAGGQDATFIKTTAGLGEGYAIFKDCQFINIGSAAMTLGITGAGLGNFKLYMPGSTFYGVTDVVAAANEASVIFGAASYTAAATSNGLGAAFDHTA